MKTRINKLSNRITKSTSKFSKRICSKTSRARYIPKSELRYKIMENTMRGYFNYSI